MQNKKDLNKEKQPLESGILIIVLAVLFGVFSVTGFVKCDYFWGINFLYYLPLWQKLLFISMGGLVFLKSFNGIVLSLYRFISEVLKSIQQRTHKLFPRIIYLFILSTTFAGLFYLFHVVSLYHAPMGAIYFMQRNIPIMDYYKEWVLVEDKYTLLLFWGAFRHLFHNLLYLSPYWSLAIPNIFCGVLFVISLDYFLRKLELQPLQQLFVFILLFTQSITYYYFGFANYYGPVPLVLFLYLLSVIIYFKKNISFLFPLTIGLFAIITHLGSIFIFPSLAFLVIQRYGLKMPGLYDLFTFKSFKKSFVIFCSILIVSYIALCILSLTVTNLQEYVVPPFKITKRYGWPLFSTGYIIHLLNVLILCSPQ